MNTIFIVLPILTLLMFDLGLTLKPNDFLMVFQRPKAVLIGLIGQLLILPLVAIALSEGFSLPALFYIGLVLVACSQADHPVTYSPCSQKATWHCPFHSRHSVR